MCIQYIYVCRILSPHHNLEFTHTNQTMAQPHFLLVAFPAQGHINPALEFANRLILNGACVTMVTCISARQRMTKKLVPDSLAIALFSDGYDDGFEATDDDDAPNRYLSEVKRRGSQYITELIKATAGNGGHPFTCLVYTLLNTWVAEVARRFQLRSVLLWVQPATVLDIYYYFFSEYAEDISNSSSNGDRVELPGLPTLDSHDLPSFLLPSNTYTFGLPSFREQLERLSEETKPTILINTFDALESAALKAIESFIMVGIGPLIPLIEKDSSNDLKEDYKEWLNLKPSTSVVFVSFGSIAVLSKQQQEELERGLLDSKHPFLWVVREQEEKEKLSCREELERQGIIVPWCSQVEVLSNPSIGCFVSHCGWNSTLESLAAGVPMVALPQWVDQPTNAKMVEDVWKTGVRVVYNEEGIAQGDEIKRCLEMVMGGEKSEELRRNARKWKHLAAEAVKDGGSSDKNLKAFVNEVRQESQTRSWDSNLQ
ncbi:crocetin glucosyltransferase chloroplastic-like [Tripterygium wilfordii]|uniref:Glycosyltransferase n=1 Tax=Tripterygium wilfordii TaxID=458696 RepID=A0A7J7D0S7_TRIWF|nr:UDP-glycosyltransferase 75C1-like [Tripterygium wilfordii]KAF5739962.1 crocetin glucosyltransferase chloroplastic-like [Tripterygium wilfordii]